MKFVVIISLILVFFSCKKAEERRCFKGVGETSSLEIELNQSFDTLYLYDDINYVLVQSETPKLLIEGGENLITHVGYSVENEILQITNNNTCNFLRNFREKMTVEIHVPTINYIYYEGSESVTNQDTIQSSSLRIRIRDGAGSVNLTVNVGYIASTITHGWGDFSLSGNALIAFVSCRTNSICDTRKLIVANDMIVDSNTEGDMYVNGDDNRLRVDLRTGGNVFYTGEPTTITKTRTGSGELIKLE